MEKLLFFVIYLYKKFPQLTNFKNSYSVPKRPKVNPSLADLPTPTEKHCIVCLTTDPAAHLHPRKEFVGQILCNTCKMSGVRARDDIKKRPHSDYDCDGSCKNMKSGDAKVREIRAWFRSRKDDRERQQREISFPICQRLAFFKIFDLQEKGNFNFLNIIELIEYFF